MTNEELCGRLREQYGNLRSGISQHPLEAADRIEALEAEVERLREALKGVTESYNHWTAVVSARAALEG